eukprot:gene16987-19358_t
MSTDRTEIIEFLFNQQIFDEQAAATAALYGRLDWLKQISAEGLTVDEAACANACSAAGANMLVLEVLLERGAKLDPLAAAYAAQNNKLNCLEFLYTHSGPWDKNTTAVAAGCGHVNCLRYAMENGCDYDATEVLICAAKADSLSCLQCLIEEHSIHMPEDGTLFEAAFVYGHYPCVQYLLDKLCGI